MLPYINEASGRALLPSSKQKLGDGTFWISCQYRARTTLDFLRPGSETCFVASIWNPPVFSTRNSSENRPLKTAFRISGLLNGFLGGVGLLA
jgi:hypothetical protein